MVATETCKNCGRIIGALEEAYLFRNLPVCKECNQRLTEKPKSPLLYAAVGAASVAIVALILFAGVFLRTRRPQQMEIQPATASPPSNAAMKPPALPIKPTPIVPVASPQPTPTPLAVVPRPLAQIPSTATVSGAAYVVREGGQSDILRGFHVSLLQPTVPASVMQAALSVVVRNYKSDAADSRNKAAQLRSQFADITTSDYDPGKYDADNATTAESNATRYGRLLSEISGPAASIDALRILRTTDYVNVIQGLVDAITISTTTTNVQGSYKFDDAPNGSLVFAMFDTKDGFLMWAVPIKETGQIDLFNDTALK